MDKVWPFIVGVCALYGAVMSTYNFFKDRNDGEITDNGITSPSGKDLLKKESR